MTPQGQARLGELVRQADRSLLVARAGAGVVLLVVPDVVSQLWLGRRSAGSRRFARATGVRDLVLCVGQRRARSPRTRRRWQRAGGLADVSDAAVAIGSAVSRRHPPSAAVAIPALGAALITLVASPDRNLA